MAFRKNLAELPPDDPEVIAAQLTEAEKKLDRLKSLYETFFLGMERIPPATQRREMNRLILELQQVRIRKAVLRFRLQTLLQKWSLHITYWNRTMREIEMGTYRRDLAKVQTRMANRGEAMTEELAIAIGIPSQRAKNFAERHNTRLATRGVITNEEAQSASTPTPEPLSAGATRPRSASAEPENTDQKRDPRREVVPGMTEADVTALYKRYEAAQRRTGDMRGPGNEAQLRQLIRRQASQIMQKHLAFGVSFDVAVKEGRVILRAKPLR